MSRNEADEVISIASFISWSLGVYLMKSDYQSLDYLLTELPEYRLN